MWLPHGCHMYAPPRRIPPEWGGEEYTPLNTTSKHTLRTHPQSTPFKHTLQAHPRSTPSKHTLGGHPQMRQNSVICWILEHTLKSGRIPSYAGYGEMLPRHTLKAHPQNTPSGHTLQWGRIPSYAGYGEILPSQGVAGTPPEYPQNGGEEHDGIPPPSRRPQRNPLDPNTHSFPPHLHS